MTAALATIVFLSVLWMLVVVGSMVFERSGAKILAALRGNSMDRPSVAIPARARHLPRTNAAMRANARFRAAA